ncbi:UNVERIFIED_CONTAM: hypothetical protein RMT77_009149 [Armadillidium vulgare]
MKFLVVFGLFAACHCLPRNILDVSAENHQIQQDLNENKDSYVGYYSWTSPEGHKYFVRYVADKLGFRIIDSNVVPVSNAGVKVDGNQGSFVDSDEHDDDDDNDVKSNEVDLFSNEHDDNDDNDSVEVEHISVEDHNDVSKEDDLHQSLEDNDDKVVSNEHDDYDDDDEYDRWLRESFRF